MSVLRIPFNTGQLNTDCLFTVAHLSSAGHTKQFYLLGDTTFTFYERTLFENGISSVRYSAAISSSSLGITFFLLNATLAIDERKTNAEKKENIVFFRFFGNVLLWNRTIRVTSLCRELEWACVSNRVSFSQRKSTTISLNTPAPST